MQIVLILILLTLWLVISAICGITGFFIGVKYKPKAEPRAAPDGPTDEKKRKAERRQKEIDNMLSFDGEPQEDIEV